MQSPVVMTRPEDKQNKSESQRILDRIQKETEGSGILGSAVKRAENHLSAKDADQQDWAEVWGTRIGRSIGAFVVVVLFIYLVNYLVSPA